MPVSASPRKLVMIITCSMRFHGVNRWYSLAPGVGVCRRCCRRSCHDFGSQAIRCRPKKPKVPIKSHVMAMKAQ